MRTPGEYRFRTLSDDGSRVRVDGRDVVVNDGIHAPSEQTGSVQLQPGPHTIRVDYFQGPREEIALQLFWTPPGGQEQIFDSTQTP